MVKTIYPFVHQNRREVKNTIHHILNFTLKSKKKKQNVCTHWSKGGGRWAGFRCSNSKELKWSNPTPEICCHHRGHSKGNKLTARGMANSRESKPTIKDKAGKKKSNLMWKKRQKGWGNRRYKQTTLRWFFDKKLVTCTFKSF